MCCVWWHTQLLCWSVINMRAVSAHAACRVAPEHRLAPDAALDWDCLAASVQLLVSLEARDHEARLNLRRNTQCAS
jgi:N-acetyl-anhydromuramyl-L-alanine amidase AmpD